MTDAPQQADDAGQVWLIHDGVPSLPLNITSASIPDVSAAEVRRTIEVDIEATRQDWTHNCGDAACPDDGRVNEGD